MRERSSHCPLPFDNRCWYEYSVYFVEPLLTQTSMRTETTAHCGATVVRCVSTVPTNSFDGWHWDVATFSVPRARSTSTVVLNRCVRSVDHRCFCLISRFSICENEGVLRTAHARAALGYRPWFSFLLCFLTFQSPNVVLMRVRRKREREKDP